MSLGKQVYNDGIKLNIEDVIRIIVIAITYYTNIKKNQINNKNCNQ